MRKNNSLILLGLIIVIICLVACGGSETKVVAANTTQNSTIGNGSNMKKSAVQKNNQAKKTVPIDIDLTNMSSTMVYSAVSDIVYNPDKFIGKVIRMKGNLNVYQAPTRNYYNCLITDATACCQKGIEFIPAGKKVYPKDFPKDGSEIIVTGKFETYYEGDKQYFQLVDAEMRAV